MATEYISTGAPRSQVVGQEVGVPSAGQTGALRGRFRGEKRSIWVFSDIVFRGGQGVGDLGPHPSWTYGSLRLTSSRELHSRFVRAFLLLCWWLAIWNSVLILFPPSARISVLTSAVFSPTDLDLSSPISLSPHRCGVFGRRTDSSGEIDALERFVSVSCSTTRFCFASSFPHL